MSYAEFTESLSNDSPPGKINNLLLALWYERKGNWDKAHSIVQDINSRDAAWIHAYLHRREGDESNASYWYHRAEKKFPSASIDEEWGEIVRACLASLRSPN